MVFVRLYKLLYSLSRLTDLVVQAYGGAMIFPEIMAEMRRPRDFIKGTCFSTKSRRLHTFLKVLLICLGIAMAQIVRPTQPFPSYC